MTAQDNSNQYIDDLLDEYVDELMDGDLLISNRKPTREHYKQQLLKWRDSAVEEAQSSALDTGLWLTRDTHKKLLDSAVRDTEKAFGGCKNCYGKGYATVIESTSWSDTDTDIGSKGGSGKDHTSTIKYCTCDRGKQLATLNKEK